jgi:hypothetical protein
MRWLHKQPGWADVTPRELLIRQLAELDSSEFSSNLEKCRQSVIIEEKIGQLIDFYRQLIEK